MGQAAFRHEQIREAERQLHHYKRLLAEARKARPADPGLIAARVTDVRNATQRLADVRQANG